MNLTIQSAVTMSSREIADLVEKRHDNVIRTIESLIAKGVIQSPQTEEIKNASGKAYEVYSVSKRDSYVIVAQLSPEFTARLVDRWQELESKTAVAIPKTYAEALRLAADQAEQLALMAPKAKFVDSYVEASGSFGFREAAKILGVKENEFRKFLIDHEIYYYLAGKPTAYAHHIDAGRFTVKTGENEANGHAFSQTKFTPKGIEWVAGLIASEKAKAALNEVV